MKTPDCIKFCDEVYGIETRIVIAKTHEEANKKIGFKVFQEFDGNGVTNWLYNKGTQRPNNCVWIKEFNPKSATDVCTLTHELLHAAVNTFKLLDIEFNYEYQEAMNYYHSYLVRTALKQLSFTE